MYLFINKYDLKSGYSMTKINEITRNKWKTNKILKIVSLFVKMWV